MADEVQLRIHGEDTQPTLVYLPGLHGNWLLIDRFREALGGKVRFVEATYPPTREWSLEDFAAGMERALVSRGVTRGWLLGESFGSQIVWPILARNNFKAEGLVLAGGFVRHPLRLGVQLAERLCGELSLGLITRVLFGYATLSRWRFRRAPETADAIKKFVDGLTEADRQAAKHRLHLIKESDPCAMARQVELPVYALTGFFDPVVPWYWVRRWLRKNCSSLREYKVIWAADHNVLGRGAVVAAEQVLRWMGSK
jgi:pimeloyl-ACP methyl ester carboxylesterase